MIKKLEAENAILRLQILTAELTIQEQRRKNNE